MSAAVTAFASGDPRLADEEEDRDREDEEQDRRQPEPVGDRDVEEEDQQPDEDRAAVADPRSRAPTACRASPDS